MHSDFARATVAFFAIIDPIGGIIVFEALAVGARRRWTIALLAVIVSLAFITLFAVAGKTLLELLGISTASFQVAAGVLLVLPAIRLVEQGQVFEAEAPAGGFQLDAAIVPLALPMLSGPGALALATTYAAKFGVATTVSAAALVLAVTLLMLVSASVILSRLHAVVLRAASRVVGLLLMAIAVNFIVTGWQGFAQ